MTMNASKQQTHPAVRILLVDDDRLSLAITGEGLGKQGYLVETTLDGHEALTLCKQNPPDLAILDVRMPGKSGIDVARELRTTTDVPYLFLSAYGESDIVKIAVEEGALGYLMKPIDVPQIVPTIEAALARARELRAMREREAQLHTALVAGRESSIAVGLLMERYRLDRATAFEALRLNARSQRRKLEEVAADMVSAAEHTYLPAELLAKLRNSSG
jgi:two-component system, response regulator PdtaR